MRADRLVSILMLLQSRGRMTARELAETLEVSERTIYRDMDALSAAGIPVYTDRGYGGGCSLMEDYHTRLDGLTASELKSLFLLAAPGPLDALEVGRQLKAALFKVQSAAAQAADAAGQKPRIHLDWSSWRVRPAPSDRLEALYQAVTRSCRVRLAYRAVNRMQVSGEFDPLGLVAKGGEWYLVAHANGKTRHFRVAEIDQVDVLESGFSYPPGFDLAAYWNSVCSEYEAESSAYIVQVRLSPAGLQELAWERGELIRSTASAPDERGWVQMEIPFEHFYAARDRLLALGSSIEVLEPLPLRLAMADFAAQISRVYAAQT